MGHSGTPSTHAAGQAHRGGVTSAAAGDGNWGGIAHRRPIQCLLKPTPPCALRLCAPAQVVVGVQPEPREKGHRSSGLHRKPRTQHTMGAVQRAASSSCSPLAGGDMFQSQASSPRDASSSSPWLLQAAGVISCARSKGTSCSRLLCSHPRLSTPPLTVEQPILVLA